MSISGITSKGNPMPDEQPKVTKQEKQDFDWGIFAKDGVISVEEQQEVLRAELNSNSTIQEAISKGLNFETIFASSTKYLHELGIVGKDRAEFYIDIAKNYIKKALDNSIQLANDFIANLNRNENQSKKLNNPPNIYTGDFSSPEVFDYIMDKFESMGLEFGDKEINGLKSIMASLDFDIDSNQDSYISVKEADDYGATFMIDYMKKDTYGKPVDTHILDWMINKYLAKTKSEN